MRNARFLLLAGVVLPAFAIAAPDVAVSAPSSDASIVVAQRGGDEDGGGGKREKGGGGDGGGKRERGESGGGGDGGGGAERARPERAERPERMERPERAERPERTERPERAERPERMERPERAERPERPERMERPERAEKPERMDRPERAEKPERPDKAERPDRMERPDRAQEPAGGRMDRPEKADRPERAERPERMDRPDKAQEPSGRGAQNPDAGRPDRAERPDRMDRGDGAGNRDGGVDRGSLRDRMNASPDERGERREDRMERREDKQEMREDKQEKREDARDGRQDDRQQDRVEKLRDRNKSLEDRVKDDRREARDDKDRLNDKIDRLKDQRKERKDGDRIVITEPGGRTIIREGGRTIIRRDEGARVRIGIDSRNIREERRNGEIRTVITRPDGSRIVTVTDDNGRLIRRVRESRGQEYVLIDNRRRGGGENVFISLDVPAPRISIPRERYIVDARGASEDDIEEAFDAPPVEKLERSYSLDEIRQSAPLRQHVRSVDLDAITFDTGSWDVRDDQVKKLEKVGLAMEDKIKKDPRTIFMIEGHTDAVGTDDDNLSLSDRRAESIAETISKYFDVPAENLTTQGYGEQFLKVQTDGPEERNRRATVRNITSLLQTSERN